MPASTSRPVTWTGTGTRTSWWARGRAGARGMRIGACRPFGTGAHGRGLRVAIADVNADGTPEIAVARLRHGAHLRAFTAGTWTRLGALLGGHPPPGAVYLG